MKFYFCACEELQLVIGPRQLRFEKGEIICTQTELVNSIIYSHIYMPRIIADYRREQTYTYLVYDWGGFLI